MTYEKISTEAKTSNLGEWFLASTINHFWIKRRFEVFCSLIKEFNLKNPRVGDVGCGHGVMQLLCEKKYGWAIDGFDLDEEALRNSIAPNQKKFLYNIYEKNHRFLNCYNLIFLFDVLEHLENEKKFISAVQAHLRPGGILAINVPANQWLFSRYDTAAGHFRRYTPDSLDSLRHGLPFKCLKMTEWGAPYFPLLVGRKLFTFSKNPKKILRQGFKIDSNALNRILLQIGRFEKIPNKHPGTSVMAFWEKM